MRNKEIQRIVGELPHALRSHGLYPDPVMIDGPTTTPEVIINGRKVIQFSSGNYLGLAQDNCAIRALIDGELKYGLTSSGSRLVCGTQEPHLELEREITEFQGTEESVLFFLVTVANATVINDLLNSPLPGLLSQLGVKGMEGDKEIFFDWLSHPSVTSACAMAVGKGAIPYRHLDMDDLEQKLKKSKAEIRMIATDGMFSADGDLAPLPEIVQLAERYEATVFVDDAHGTGILGENGRGTWEHFGLKDEIDIKVGSLAKAFSGGLGGFVTGSHDLCDYVRVAGGHYIFGGSIPPAIAMAITSNIRTARNEPWRRKKVIENSEYLRTELRKRGFGVLGDNSPIVPIVMGKSEPTLAVSKELMEAGFFIPTFRYPATPMNKARLRATLMATHTKEQIDGFIAALVEISEKNGICP